MEESEKEELPPHLTLNSREKFERIAEQYPLVKELKDKLNSEDDLKLDESSFEGLSNSNYLIKNSKKKYFLRISTKDGGGTN